MNLSLKNLHISKLALSVWLLTITVLIALPLIYYLVIYTSFNDTRILSKPLLGVAKPLTIDECDQLFWDQQLGNVIEFPFQILPVFPSYTAFVLLAIFVLLILLVLIFVFLRLYIVRIKDLPHLYWLILALLALMPFLLFKSGLEHFTSVFMQQKFPDINRTELIQQYPTYSRLKPHQILKQLQENNRHVLYKEFEKLVFNEPQKLIDDFAGDADEAKKLDALEAYKAGSKDVLHELLLSKTSFAEGGFERFNVPLESALFDSKHLYQGCRVKLPLELALEDSSGVSANKIIRDAQFSLPLVTYERMDKTIAANQYNYLVALLSNYPIFIFGTWFIYVFLFCLFPIAVSLFICYWNTRKSA